MEHYEIRVVSLRGGARIYAFSYINDYAAMRSARLMADTDDRIEIWRGMHCIYQNRPAEPLRSLPPEREQG